MSFQLIIRDENDASLKDFFRRGKRIDFQELPFVFPGSLLPEGVRLQFMDAGDGKHAALKVHTDGEISVNGELLNIKDAPRILRSSDRIVCRGTSIRFYQLHGRPGVSWRANSLGLLARIGVAAVIILEIFAVFALPVTLKHQQRWRAESEMQEIAWQTDQLRKRLSRLDSRDPLVNTWLNAARDEVVRRIRFLRENGEKLTASQRTEMLQDITRLSNAAEQLSTTVLTQEQERELKLDETIRSILEE